jgi:formiminotetrahydrofolate cyclodeaminase
MSISDLSCAEFIQALAAKQPYPGGGGAAALTAAIGIALGDMVGSYTLGKKKYAAYEEAIAALKARCSELENELLFLVDEDARVFEPLSLAYGLPEHTAKEQALKAEIMERCLKEAVAVPLRIMELCCEAIDILLEFADKGSSLMVSDAGCGAATCKAALEAAALNVFVNTKSMQDRKYAEQLNLQADELLFDYSFKAEMIYKAVQKSMR